MKKTIYFRDFIAEFEDSSHRDDFSREALEAIFDMLEEIDVEMEFDLIAICCDYTESTWKEFCENYDIELDENYAMEDEDEDGGDYGKFAAETYLRRNGGWYAETATGVVYQQF